MKTGPNELCPCGSGKKYKKCCMLIEEAVTRTAADAPAADFADSPAAPIMIRTLGPAPSREKSERRAANLHSEAWKAMLADYCTADLSRKLAIFRQQIDDGSMDEETAFELLIRLLPEAAERGEPNRFDEAAALLRERLPRVCEHEAHNIDGWLLDNALFCGMRGSVAEIGIRMVAHAATHHEAFKRSIRLLMFHGELQLVLRIMEAAWPAIRDSDDLFESEVDEYAALALRMLLLESAERLGPGAQLDDDLLKRMKPFGKFDLDVQRSFLDHITGRSGRSWTMADLDFPAVPQTVDPPERKRLSRAEKQDKERRKRNLGLLAAEFAGWAQREAGVPATRAELGVREIEQYILNRAEGGLGPHFTIEERMSRRDEIKTIAPFPKPEHVLCPDRQTVDRYLSVLVGMIHFQVASFCAFLAMIPTWLRFLQSRRLVDDATRQRSLTSVSALIPHARELPRSTSPALRNAFDRWGASPSTQA